MLSVQQLHDLLATRPSGLNHGRIMAANEREKRQMRTSSPAQRRLLAALVEHKPEPRTQYQHPDRVVRLEPSTSAQYTLSPADIAWIQGLPAAQATTYQDAVQLAGFARQVKRRSSDERLVNSKWAAVKAIHDRKEAEVELANASLAWPEIPRSDARDALAEAIEAATEELTTDEGVSRADRLLDEALAARSALQERHVDAARRTLDQLTAATEQREALTA